MATNFYASAQDTTTTISEWPIRIWSMDEFPKKYESYALDWMKSDFSAYQFVLSPRKRSTRNSFEYLFGYGENSLLYLKSTPEGMQKISLNRCDVISVKTKKELLNAEIEITYKDQTTEKTLIFPYIPSTYYIYDPFLNWLLGMEPEFDPVVAEKKNPRPRKLYNESLTMFNYSLHAYRLGNGFSDYTYKFEKFRPFWTPWKVIPKEWLEVEMERGTFKLFSFRYLTECTYIIKQQ